MGHNRYRMVLTMTKELKNWTDEELEDGRQQLLPVAGNGVAATVNADAVFALSAIEREQNLRKDARSRPDYGRSR